jgi:hypothetical protein
LKVIVAASLTVADSEIRKAAIVLKADVLMAFPLTMC